MVVDQDVESLSRKIPDHIQEPGVYTIVGDVVVAYSTDAVREGWCHLRDSQLKSNPGCWMDSQPGRERPPPLL